MTAKKFTVKPVTMIGAALFVLVLGSFIVAAGQKMTDSLGVSGGDREQVSKATANTSSSPKPDGTAAKKAADGITVESTGSAFYSGEYHYGFLLVNNGKQPFTGKVTIMLTNDGKYYSDAELELTEHDPAGTIPAPGVAKGYSYKVTVNGVTTELYPVHDILVN
jgi:hypothetical protein